MTKDNKKLEVPDTNVGKYIKIGLSVIFVVFGILGVWAYYAKMDTGVPLAGKVVVEANKKVIQHLEGGIVEKIYVKDGNFVRKGDKLIKFSDTKARATLNSIKAKYYEAIVLADRLRAENEKRDKISFSKELNELDRTKREKLQNAQIEIFNNRRNTLLKEEKVAEQKIKSLEKQVSNLEDIISTKQRLLSSYEEEQKEQEALLKERLIDKTKIREIKRKIESIKSDILSSKSDIKRISYQIDEIKTNLALKKEDFYAKVKQELRDTIISIEDMEAKMTEVKDRLKRTILRAPVSGTVLGLKVHTIGAVVSSGKPIMEIVPKDSKLIIEAKLSPMYIDYVKVGLKANMTFPAFQMKGRFIKKIEGEVIFVAADSTVDDKGNSFYIVKLIVDDEGNEVLRKENLKLLAGMPANVVIKIGQQTMFEYIVKPMTIMLDRAFLEE